MHGIKSLTLGIAVFAILALGAAAIYLARENWVRGGHPLPPTLFLESPGSYEGNTYDLTVLIDHQVVAGQSGRVLMVRDIETQQPLLVTIPNHSNETYHPKQRYRMRVSVVDGHLLLNQSRKY